MKLLMTNYYLGKDYKYLEIDKEIIRLRSIVEYLKKR